MAASAEITKILAGSGKLGSRVLPRNAGALSSLADLHQSEDDSVIATLGGVPIGFQFGTAMGFDGIPALALDILLDPITYASGGLGSLTKLARGGKVLARASKALAKGEATGDKLIDAAAIVHRSRGLTKADLVNSVVPAIETAGRMDTRPYQEMEALLRVAKDDNEAIKALMMRSAGDQALRFKAFRRAVPKGEGVSKFVKGSKSARERLQTLTPSAQDITRDQQVERVLDAIGAAKGKGPQAGIEAGLKQIRHELQMRDELKKLAIETRANPTLAKLEEVAKRVHQLSPSARTQLALTPHRLRELHYAAELIEKGHAEKAVSAALQQGPELASGARGGQRGVLHFRTPFASFSVGTGEVANRIGAFVENTPIVRDLMLRNNKFGGLVPGARRVASENRRGLLLDEFRDTAGAPMLLRSLRDATSALRGLKAADTTFQSINDTYARELNRGSLFAAKLHATLGALSRKEKWTPEDGFNLIRLMDDPAKFVVHPNAPAVKAARRKAEAVAATAKARAVSAVRHYADEAARYAAALSDEVLRLEELRKKGSKVTREEVAEAKELAEKIRGVAREASKTAGRRGVKTSKRGSRASRTTTGTSGGPQGRTARASLGRIERSFKRAETDSRRFDRMATEAERILKETKFSGATFTEAATKAGMKPEHLDMAQMLFEAFERAGVILKSQGAIEHTIADYFPRLISFVKKGKDRQFEDGLENLAKKFERGGSGGGKVASTFLGSSIPRVQVTLDHLRGMEKAGILTLEKDPATILRKFFEASNHSAATARLLRRMGTATWEPNLEKALAGSERLTDVFLVSTKGDGGFTKAEKALIDSGEYVNLSNDGVVMRFIREIGDATGGAKAQFRVGNEQKAAQWTGARQVYVPELAAKAIRNVLAPEAVSKAGRVSEGTIETMMRGALMANSVMKRSLLMTSAFHHMALTESAVAVLGFKALRIPGKVFRDTKGRTQNRREGAVAHFFQADDVIDMATRNGLQLGVPIDPMLDDLQKVLRGADRLMGRAAGKEVNAFGKVGGAFAWWDRGLWDYYHNGLKLTAWHELWMRSLAHPSNQKIKPRYIAEGIAEHVNNAFGGQMWRSFWIGKSGEQFLRLFWFAPDWTISNLKIATDVFTNGLKRHLPGLMRANNRFVVTSADVMKADVRATYARQYALRAAIISAVGWNFLNLATTSWNGGNPDMSEGRWLHENPPGNRTRIDLRFTNANGRPQYMVPGKQFREPLEAVEDLFAGVPVVPEQFLARKSAPTFTILRNLVLNEDYFGRPIAAPEDGISARFWKSALKTGEEALPIPVQTVLDGGASIGAIAGAMGLPFRNGVDGPEGSAEAMEALLGSPAYRRSLDVGQRGMASQALKGL